MIWCVLGWNGEFVLCLCGICVFVDWNGLDCDVVFGFCGYWVFWEVFCNIMCVGGNDFWNLCFRWLLIFDNCVFVMDGSRCYVVGCLIGDNWKGCGLFVVCL